MKYTMLIFMSCCFLWGCQKKNLVDGGLNSSSNYLKATVIQTSDISCSMPLLDFAEDALRIRNITHRLEIIYTAANLPAHLNIQNQKLYLSVTTLPPEEFFACNTLGIMYPTIKVVDAKIR